MSTSPDFSCWCLDVMTHHSCAWTDNHESWPTGGRAPIRCPVLAILRIGKLFISVTYIQKKWLYTVASWPKNNRLITDGEIIDCLCRGNNREYPPGRQESVDLTWIFVKPNVSESYYWRQAVELRC